MTAAASRSTAQVPGQRMQRARGDGRLCVVARDDSTHVRTLFQEGCAKIRLPHTHTPALQAVLMNTTGGLTGGDDLRWSLTAGAGARVVVTTPACERVYRTLGGPARVSNRLVVEDGAHLDWLPQETILYDNCELERTLEVDLAATAAFTAVETVLLGRQAMGEAALNARLRDNWRIRRGGRLLHAEATLLSGAAHERQASSLLANAQAFATLLHIGPDAERRLALVRPLLGNAAGASLAGDRLTVRLMADSGLALRRVLTPIIAVLSSSGTIPRLWSL